MPKIIRFIGYKKLVPEAQAPYQKYKTDAGYDLSAVSITKTDDYIEYGTGIAVEIPTHMVGLVFPRSSVTGKDLLLKNCVGVIDSQYRGEIRCRFYETKEFLDYVQLDLFNGTSQHIHQPRLKRNVYEIGERVCQIIFLTLPEISLREKQELSDTDRGDGGFGHTGK